MSDPAAQLPIFAGKYRLVRILGKGAMGEVWLAEEEGPRNFRRRVAVKRLLASNELGDFATESFVAEAQVIARVDHPNVVRLIELGAVEGELYLVLDFVDGVALDRVIKKTGALLPQTVAYLGREVARALEAVHSLCDDDGRNYGVVHRDVSPSNILLSRDGRVRLTDFGVARISGLGGERTETGVFKGKLPYMPPEQARGEPFDGRADVFSLGVTLFEALLGRRLRKAETHAQLLFAIAHDAVARVCDLLPDASPALARAIDASTEIDLARRTGDAGALAAALDAAMHALGPSAEADARAELKSRIETLVGPPSASTTFSGQERLPASVTAPPPPTDWKVDLAAQGPPTVAVRSGDSGTGPTARSRTGLTPAPEPTGAAREGGPASISQTGLSSIAETTRLPPSRGGRPALLLGAVTLLGAAAAFAVFGRGEPHDPASSDAPVEIASTAPTTSPPATGADAQPSAAPGDVAPAGDPSAAVDVASASASAPAPAPTVPTRVPGKLPQPKPSAASSSTASAAPGGAEASEPGTLQVVVLPWAEVSVDGRGVGTTPIPALPLSPGSHTVVLRNSELGASRTMSVNVKPGKPTLLRVDLRKND